MDYDALLANAADLIQLEKPSEPKTQQEERQERPERGYGLYVLDENGEPTPAQSLGEYSDMFSDDNNEARRVGRDQVIGPRTGQAFTVSTVFVGLGLDRMWETMVFDEKNSSVYEMKCSGSRVVAGAQHLLVMQQLMDCEIEDEIYSEGSEWV